MKKIALLCCLCIINIVNVQAERTFIGSPNPTEIDYSGYSMKVDTINVTKSVNLPINSVSESQIVPFKVSLSTGVTGSITESQVTPYKVSLSTGTMGQVSENQIVPFKVSLATGTVGTVSDGQVPVISISTGTTGNMPDERLPKISLSTGTMGQVNESQITPYKTSLSTGTMGQVTESQITPYKTSLATATVGIVPDGQLPIISISTGTTGNMPDGRLPKVSLSTGTAGQVNESQIVPFKVSLATGTVGTVPDGQIPVISISTGTTGNMPDARLPVISISTGTTGNIPDGRLPKISLSTATAGQIPAGQVEGWQPSISTGISGNPNQFNFGGLVKFSSSTAIQHAKFSIEKATNTDVFIPIITAPDRTYDLVKFNAIITTNTYVSGTQSVRCKLAVCNTDSFNDVNINYSTMTVNAGVFYSTDTFISTSITPTQMLRFSVIQGIGWETSGGYLNVDVWYKEH